MLTTYRCVCCQLEGKSGICSCVFSSCYRCFRCAKCCLCPERLVRECAAEVGLDDPEGPFAEKKGAATDDATSSGVR
jgi:hypothetical protein